MIGGRETSTLSCILVVNWYELLCLFPESSSILSLRTIAFLFFWQLVSLFIHQIVVRLRDLVDMLHLSSAAAGGNFDGPRCNTVTDSFSQLQT